MFGSPVPLSWVEAQPIIPPACAKSRDLALSRDQPPLQASAQQIIPADGRKATRP